MSIKFLTSKELQADSIRMARVNRDKSVPEDTHYFNADGFCSVYAHACGYQDTFYDGPFRLYMYLDGPCYHVRIYHDEKPAFLWNSFDGSTARNDAKKSFRQLRTWIKRGASIEELRNMQQ